MNCGCILNSLYITEGALEYSDPEVNSMTDYFTLEPVRLILFQAFYNLHNYVPQTSPLTYLPSQNLSTMSPLLKLK